VAGGQALECAGEDLDLVGLLALGGETVLAGATGVEPRLNVKHRQRDAGGAAVDDAAERGAVALAPGGDAEEVAEGIELGGDLARAGAEGKPGS
jgi:hypothetical protein